MTDTAPPASPASRLRLGRSVLAILIAIAINVAASLTVDEVFHLLGVYPPWGAAMPDTGDNVLALSYRLVITVWANVLALRFAGYAPGGHALALAGVGTLLGTLGAIQTTAPGAADFGPDWYPWSLAVTAPLCALASWWIVTRRR